MGRLGKILSFIRADRNEAKVSDVKADPGGGPNITAEHFAPTGEDAHPLPGDYVATVRAPGTGRETAIGYLDPKNESTAQPGERRTYSREPEEGRRMADHWLKNDGTVVTTNYDAEGAVVSVIEQAPDGTITATTGEATFYAKADGAIKGANGSGSFELAAGGDFLVNGVKIAADGSVTVPDSLVLAGKELADHTHAGSLTAPSGPVSPTGVNQ